MIFRCNKEFVRKPDLRHVLSVKPFE